MIFRLIIFIFCFFLSTPLMAAPEKSDIPPMRKVYKSFKNLQPFITDPSSVSIRKNSEKIYNLVQDLKRDFEKSKSALNAYQEMPGFKANVNIMLEALDEVLWDLEHRQSPWAVWRLKAISSNCRGCHTSYEVDIEFDDQNVNLEKFNSYQKGEFFLASRQYEEAKEAYWDVVSDPSREYSSLMALRRWLDIMVRVEVSPGRAAEDLKALLKKRKFPEHDRKEINNWIQSLETWKENGGEIVPELSEAKRLLKGALLSPNPLYASLDAVTLLRASAILHRLLESKETIAKERREGLFLLGLAYTRLPLFFISEFPELFLEQCIREFPGTNDAQEAYKLYREYVTNRYTGSSGTDVPGDIHLKFQELHDLAYGIKKLEGKV